MADIGALSAMGRQVSSAGRPLRVVVGGAGTAGLTVANLLRDAGIDVHVVAPALEPRRGSVMVERGAWEILHRAGVDGALRDAPLDDASRHKMISIRSLEMGLDDAAHARGVSLTSGQVQRVDQMSGGVRVHVRADGGSSSRAVDADWYVDATGGASPVARSEAFRREPYAGEFGVMPVERHFVAQRAAAVEGKPLGWTAADGSFAINDAREGVVTAYRGFEAHAAGSSRVPSVQEGRDLLETLGVDPTRADGAPFAFTTRQTLSRSAAHGRAIAVGDTVGTVHPSTQAGILLAATDAQRAAGLIIGASDGRGADAVADAVADYDVTTRTMHELYLA